MEVVLCNRLWGFDIIGRDKLDHCLLTYHYEVAVNALEFGFFLNAETVRAHALLAVAVVEAIRHDDGRVTASATLGALEMRSTVFFALIIFLRP